MNCTINKLALTKMQAAIIATILIATILPLTYLLLPSKENATISLKVISRPASFGEVVYSIPGQKCLFLVFIEKNQADASLEPVNLSIISSNCQADIYPKSITFDQVAELAITPVQSNIGKNATITLQAERKGQKQTKTITTEVIEGENTLEPKAASIRDKFTAWLSQTCPEISITNETAWTGTIVNPKILVVMHYIFLSEDWEMYVTWHIMIPPYDWARIYLRQRYNQTAPTYAFEIASVQEESQPQRIEVPDWV